MNMQPRNIQRQLKCISSQVYVYKFAAYFLMIVISSIKVHKRSSQKEEQNKLSYFLIDSYDFKCSFPCEILLQYRCCVVNFFFTHDQVLVSNWKKIHYFISKGIHMTSFCLSETFQKGKDSRHRKHTVSKQNTNFVINRIADILI